MEWFLLIALMWGGFKALDKGATMAARSAKDAARRYTSAKPAKPNNAGAKAGRAVATGWFAGVEAARGFGAGWRSGWPEGRQQAYDWRDRRRAAKADGQPDSQPDNGSDPEYKPGQFKPGDPVHWIDDPETLERFPDAQDEGVVDEVNDDGTPWVRMASDPDKREILCGLKPGLLPDPDPESNHPGDRWRRAYFRARSRSDGQDPRKWADEHMDDRGAYVPETTNDEQEDEDMSEPNSGNSSGNGGGGGQRSGEVTNYPQLLEALKRIEQDAADDLEDAQADETRAQQDKAEVDGMVASLSRLKLDQGTISAVHEIAEAAQAREEAARNRAKAAEQRNGTARNAHETVKRNYEQYYEAAQSAPAVPEREFAATG